MGIGLVRGIGRNGKGVGWREEEEESDKAI